MHCAWYLFGKLLSTNWKKSATPYIVLTDKCALFLLPLGLPCTGRPRVYTSFATIRNPENCSVNQQFIFSIRSQGRPSPKATKQATTPSIYFKSPSIVISLPPPPWGLGLRPWKTFLRYTAKLLSEFKRILAQKALGTLMHAGFFLLSLLTFSTFMRYARAVQLYCLI